MPRLSVHAYTFVALVLTPHLAFAASADAIYRNGRIYTLDAARPWAQAVAIRDGRFVAVGSDADVAELAGPATRVVDLAGRMAMPGIHDLHVHATEAGMAALYECSFPFTTPIDAILAKIRECAASAPPGTWIRGGQWAAESLAGAAPPTLAALDAAAPDHPVFLIDSTVHNAWVNSQALAVLAIGRDTPDPEGGVIVRDAASGEPTGILFDNAAYNAWRKLPVRSLAQYRDALAWSIARMNAVGVVAIKDAFADGHTVAGYAALDRAGALNVRVATSRPWRASFAESAADQQRNIERWAEAQTPRLRTGFAKMFLDGIPPTRTAAMLEPYPPAPGVAAGFRGKLQHPGERLRADVAMLDRLGLTVKMHATGDASLREGLDAIEAAREANGDSGLRHEIAHAELAHPDDIPRFAKLGAVAELSPILWYPASLVENMAAVIGRERADRFWPIRSLLEAGALLVYGSDWPSVVPSPNPWPGIEAMVTRRDPYGQAPGALGPEQAIGLSDALVIFTRNGATGMRMEQEAGTIAVGRYADLIVLDRHLFEIPPDTIGDTQVDETVLEGRVVYTREPATAAR